MSSTGAHILYAGEDNDKGGQGPAPLPESWVTIHVEGKPVGFMVDTGPNTQSLTRKMDQCPRRPAGYKGPLELNDMNGLLNVRWTWGPNECPTHFL